jgi:hypothetical protein
MKILYKKYKSKTITLLENRVYKLTVEFIFPQYIGPCLLNKQFQDVKEPWPRL